MARGDLSERDLLLVHAYAKQLHYQQAANELNWDKNKIYSATVKLEKLGIIRKISPGRYEVIKEVNGVVKKLPPLEPPPTTPIAAPIPPPVVVEPPPKHDIEVIVDALIGKIAELRPLLLLHKDLFTVFENVAFALIDRVSEMKARTLTQEEWDEYQDLKAKKQRALEIVKTKYRKSN